jgi:hypothetical protein
MPTGIYPGKVKHGHAREVTGKISREYSTWRCMVQRCTNPKVPNWRYYGGRGIGVCERWMKFKNFLDDMGLRPQGKSLDRWPNKDGNYEPGNCRWATQQEQIDNSNKKRHCGPWSKARRAAYERRFKCR